MHHMEVGDDNLSFAIWTGSDPDASIFTMTVSSPEKKKDWLLALQKLQESQISFAMGKLNADILEFCQRGNWTNFLKSLLVKVLKF